MPRVADHDQRREQVAAAFRRLVAADGIGGVTFTKVARDAGVSVGLIQHYFADKDALLRFVYDDAVRRTGERVRARVRGGEAARQPTAQVLLDSLLELVPLDAERDVEYRVRQSLQAQALHHPELGEVARRSGREILAYVTAVVEHGRSAGEVPPDVDAVLAARTVLATVQGLADQVALSGRDAFDARAVLGPVVRAVFPGKPL